MSLLAHASVSCDHLPIPSHHFWNKGSEEDDVMGAGPESGHCALLAVISYRSQLASGAGFPEPRNPAKIRQVHSQTSSQCPEAFKVILNKEV